MRITAIQSINLEKVIDIKRFSRNIRLESARDHYVRGKIGAAGRTKRRNISKVYHLVRFRTPAITKTSKSHCCYSRGWCYTQFSIFFFFFEFRDNYFAACFTELWFLRAVYLPHSDSAVILMITVNCVRAVGRWPL